ncbi:MAG: hypothetical protein K2X09_03250 [Rickettsiales bacterium]|nr:hypothetical protein [Rickettsiales bacterium]
MTETDSTQPLKIDLDKLGNKSCDTGALNEGWRIMGFDKDGKPLDGKGLDLEQLYAALPQLFTTNATGEIVLSPRIDIATLHVESKSDPKGIVKATDCFDKLGPDGKLFNAEVLAAVVTAGQAAKAQGIALKDVKIETIINGMKAPLEKILHLKPAICSIGD